MTEQITKTQCSKNQEIIFLKMEKLLDKTEAKIIERINQLGDKFYSKESGEKLEESVEKIKAEREKRSYEWLKYIITFLLGIGAQYLLNHLN